MRQIAFFLILIVVASGGVGAVQFTDVQGHWAETAILRLADRGVINGYPDGSYRPDQPVTRAEMAKLLMKTATGPILESFALFPDVAPEHWAYSDIGSAGAQGWIKGYPDGTFCPERPVTVYETIVMMVRTKRWQTITPSQPFFDNVKPGNWTFPEVMTALRHHLILVPDPHFVAMPDPQPHLEGAGSADRAQVAVLVDRALRIISERIPYDLAGEQIVQTSVDQGHQPWRLDPEQTAASYLMGEAAVKDIGNGRVVMEYNDGKDAFIFFELAEGNFLVHLQRVVRTGPSGIWTVVEFDRGTPSGI